MSLVAARCTQCGANIEVDPTKEAGICPNCNTAFIIEKAINNYNVNYNINNANITINHNLDKSVRILCPVYQGQLFNNACIAYNNETGAELARCRQGETLSFNLTKPTQVKVVVKGSFGKPVEIMKPGERYKIGYRGFGKVYLAKVDML